MIATQIQTQTRSAPKAVLSAVHGNLLQRKCACGGTPDPSGECEECRKQRMLTSSRPATDSHAHDISLPSNQSPDTNRRAIKEPRFGHNFSQVGVHAESAYKIDGNLTVTASEEDDVITMDALIGPRIPSPSRRVPPPGPRPALSCPTDIRVADILQAPLQAANVTSGQRTGWGGVARMEVSDPSGRDWTGTVLHENIMPETNTCEPGTSACPNTSGQGAAGGSTFTVGEAGVAPSLGVTIPAVRNSFYDFHIIGLPHSILHQQRLPFCEQSCTQRFDCNGRLFGPTFIIQRTMTPDQITVGGNAVDVTRVRLDKPEQPGPGDYPERTLPVGQEYA